MSTRNPFSTTGSYTDLRQQNAFGGVYLGTVTDINDPDGLYRVKVTIYEMQEDGQQATFWARIATPMAGPDRGWTCVPEVGDEVVVGFIAGNHSRPIVIGSLWNGSDATLASLDTAGGLSVDASSRGDGEVNVRALVTRAGNKIIINDKGGEEFISITTTAGQEIAMDDAAKTIQIYNADRDQWIEIDTDGTTITVQTDSGDVHIEAANNMELKCGADMTIDVGGNLTATVGGTSDLDSTGDITWKTSAAATYESSGVTTIKGSKIDLNP